VQCYKHTLHICWACLLAFQSKRLAFTSSSYPSYSQSYSPLHFSSSSSHIILPFLSIFLSLRITLFTVFHVPSPIFFFSLLHTFLFHILAHLIVLFRIYLLFFIACIRFFCYKKKPKLPPLLGHEDDKH
jgi:hypothetical protein